MERLLSKPEAHEPNVKVVLSKNKGDRLILVNDNHYRLPFSVVFVDFRTSHQELIIYQNPELVNILPLKGIQHFELVATKRKSYTYPHG